MKELGLKVNTTHADTVTEMMRSQAVTRAREIAEAGVHPEIVRRMLRNGIIVRAGRGLYMLSRHEPSQYQTLIEVAKRAPHGVMCLLTALHFHEIGTQNPRDVWMALPKGGRKPSMAYPRLRVFRISGTTFDAGAETHVLDGVPVRIYSVARTVADCFKFRNTVGMEATIEALRESIRDRRCTIDDLIRNARLCRVERIIRPYIEAMV
jgi:predicted transcriptional regulator of viral defense system